MFREGRTCVVVVALALGGLAALSSPGGVTPPAVCVVVVRHRGGSEPAEQGVRHGMRKECARSPTKPRQ